ncbi:MAG TPA: 30S ribosomal protein S5 [Candidatus Acidoferrum sp.]|nr:30S ribosomal protein S5 [Candidatus Acidoferrum sp.]
MPQDQRQPMNRGPRRQERIQMPREEKVFEEHVINVDRVARVVKGGRRFRFKALVAVGDHKSRVGVGVAKGSDVQSAVAKATEIAKKNLVTIPIKRETLPHDAEAKIGGSRVLLKPASPGTGVIAGGVVRSIISLTNIHNLLSKSFGTNKVNTAYATIDALRQLKAPEAWLNPPAKVAAKKEE